MVILERKMEATKIDNDSKNFCSCQASLNSDGRITLRNYGVYGERDNNNDEIIILSTAETQAIFGLMRIIRANCKDTDLPF